jgi:hypothetical protein
MEKKHFIVKDSEYFQDSEDTIKLRNCPNEGNFCRGQMAYMNNRLLLVRKFIENKEFIRAIDFFAEAFDSTYDLREAQCQSCAKLFRGSIVKSLGHLVSDLEEMTKGFFSRKKYKTDLTLAKKLWQELQDKMQNS